MQVNIVQVNVGELWQSLEGAGELVERIVREVKMLQVNELANNWGDTRKLVVAKDKSFQVSEGRKDVRREFREAVVGQVEHCDQGE